MYPGDCERLYKVYFKDHNDSPGCQHPCKCEFHAGHWNTKTGITRSGISLIGTNGCLIPAAVAMPKINGIKTGYNCIKCNFKNDYACANKPDGTYLCFNCR